ncbi:MAG: ATP synthase subunit C [Candidatus Njordarchaeum guaymaensis]
MKKTILTLSIGILFAGVLLLAIPLSASPITLAQEEAASMTDAYRYIAMAISVGVSSAAAAYAVEKTGVAALASISEKPELFGKTIIIVGLAEGIAIYGLLVALLLWIT